MGTDTTPWNNVTLTFASPAAAAGFETVLRECAANTEFVTGFDRLTGSNLRLAGPPVNVAIDLASGRTDTEFRRFAAFVHDTVWSRCPAPQLAPARASGV